MKDIIEIYEARLIEIAKKEDRRVKDLRTHELRRFMAKILGCLVVNLDKEIELIKSTF